MPNYNFLNLSSFEFENITRDLLQMKYKCFIESFTSGKDDGIDLRFAKERKANIIIQAKEYGKYSDLKSTLKKEIGKVNALKPSKYILSTSVGLTPRNKDEIVSIMSPHIESTEDVLGKDDLNNLLGLYPEIEKKHYKLWLASTPILEKILHSKVYNQSQFEIEEIKDLLKIYVQNESYNKAFEILKNNKYVIISGIPGIGKTTLARMLVYNLLAKDFDEFVFLTESINDGYTFFKEEKKQIFYFDDFLGKNFLEVKPQINEDTKLVSFIEKIKKSKDKILILATREYILKQAKSTFESYNKPSLDLAKCTLDLSYYTKIIKAEILYNHIYFANIPIEYIEDLIRNRQYLKIINHPNYNPRIIETFVQKQIWANCAASEFSEKIIEFFKNPESVWLHAFENTISKEAQVTLFVLSTLGSPVLLEDLRDAINSFYIENQPKYSPMIDSVKFSRTIKELENTFITTTIDSYCKIAVSFQNPSIHDFLIEYISSQHELVFDLLKSILFFEQATLMFTTMGKDSDIFSNKKITLNMDEIKLLAEKLEREFGLLKNSSIIRIQFNNSDRYRWHKNEYFKLTFLNELLLCFGNNRIIMNIITKKINENSDPNFENYSERYSYVKILKKIDLSSFTLNKEKLIRSFLSQSDTIDAIDDFKEFRKIFPDEYETVIADIGSIKKIESVVNTEIDSTDTSDYEQLIDSVKNIETEYSLGLDSTIDELQSEYEEYMDRINEKAEADMEEYKYQDDNIDPEVNEDDLIESLFESLRR